MYRKLSQIELKTTQIDIQKLLLTRKLVPLTCLLSTEEEQFIPVPNNIPIIIQAESDIILSLFCSLKHFSERIIHEKVIIMHLFPQPGER